MNRYGGAKTGDRTMLDALSPAINVLEQSSTLSGLQSAVEVGGAPIGVSNNDIILALQAAKQGAKDTRKMVAHSGRASYVSPELLTQPDRPWCCSSEGVAASHLFSL